MAIDALDARLSKYELIRPLGAGGMGEVYLAHDRVLQRHVAIKFVSSARLADPGAERRLVREARAAAALDHPAICPVYDVLGSEGHTCIVMQYVDGETLATRLTRGPLEKLEALSLATQIAEALAVAHAAGVVHRDLKPQNIMFTAAGQPKLLDFGIAQTRLPAEVVASVVTHTATETATRSGAVIGTPAYMSPEQVLSKPIDGRSDLFSLGAVLFECLTGQPAFLAGTDVETWARVVYLTPPAPSSSNRAVTADIDAVVAKLLAKEPADRFGSASEAVAALRRLGGIGTDKLTRRQLVRVVAAVVTAVAITGFLAWRITRPRPLPPAPAAAATWYEKGTEQLRDGAYSSAQRAFQEALSIYPDYPQALARLAEAQMELDEEREATESVVRLSEIVPDAARLPTVDRVRLAAVKALVLPDRPRAADEYRKITVLTPRDRGAWLDLARVLQEAEQKADALAACEKALQIDPQFAAGHLRRGLIASDLRRGEEALKEFVEAERLYQAASNVEGQTEALLVRARFLNNTGGLNQARSVVGTAAEMAHKADNRSQLLRAVLVDSNISVRMGDFDTARGMAAQAVSTAQQNQLDTIAAEGLIDLATALTFKTEEKAAKSELEEAIALARRRDAKRVVVRGTLQLAAVHIRLGQPRDAIAYADGMLDYIGRAQYKVWELDALDIIAQAHESLGESLDAQRFAKQLLSGAEAVNDREKTSSGVETLANASATLGSLPAALALRVRLESIRGPQQQNNLSYDLANRAELLIRLGRTQEATPLLDQIDVGIKNGVKAFVGRRLKVIQLRSLIAAESGEFSTAEALALDAIGELSDLKEASSGQYQAAALLAYSRGRLAHISGRVRSGHSGGLNLVAPPPFLGTETFRREYRYWWALALLAQDDIPGALRESTTALTRIERAPSVEFEWRMTAIACEAARRAGDFTGAQTWQARSQAALRHLRDAWKDDAVRYERRADVIDRKRAINVDQH